MELLSFFSPDALSNIEEVGLSLTDIKGDILSMRDGIPPQVLLSYCLKNADQDRHKGWQEYVDTVVQLAEDSDIKV